jgi:hypothetical protein
MSVRDLRVYPHRDLERKRATRMKFYHVLHGEVDVDRVVFDPYPLADRECMNCKKQTVFQSGSFVRG